MATNSKDDRLAVLIDADNISNKYLKCMMEEIARYGNPTIKRIYGDWTRPNLAGWKTLLLDNALTPVQQFSYTSGKNSTDSALIIEAMDILYSGEIDAFCLVSSDSDFTRLATRLREAGKMVYGIGEEKTPIPFVKACDRFIFLEVLAADEAAETEEEVVATSRKNSESKNQRNNKQEKNQQRRAIRQIDYPLVQLIIQSIEDLCDDNGWAYLGDLGNLLVKKQPSFDTRVYGYKQLNKLLEALPYFEMERRETSSNFQNTRHVFVRVKDSVLANIGTGHKLEFVF